jgi:hypothetical protein
MTVPKLLDMNIAELNDMIALGFAVKQWVMYLKVKTL